MTAPLSIRRFPDPVLKRITRRVTHADPGTRRLIDAMIRTMRHHPRCVGLAAPQIGSALRLAVMDASRHPKAPAGCGLLVLVNPVLEQLDGWRVGREGCLSVPDFTADVRRAARLRLSAQDDAGVAYTIWLEGFEAVVAQHEVDHLDGMLFLDRVADPRADVFPRKTYQQ